jgi:DNA recombination protein RmuC
VLFLPGEVFFSVATEHDPSLMEFSMREMVIISTPTILLALLHSIALGWRHENLTENAREIIKMGQELYKRLADTAQHVFNLGRSINNTVQNYNATVASLESRVLVSARKFKNLELHEKNIADLSCVEDRAKSPQIIHAKTYAKLKKITNS